MDKAVVLSYVRLTLLTEYKRLGTWGKVAMVYGRPKGTLHRIVYQPGYCPDWLDKNIGTICNQPKDLFAMKKGQLKWAIKNRKVVSTYVETRSGI